MPRINFAEISNETECHGLYGNKELITLGCNIHILQNAAIPHLLVLWSFK